MSFGHNDVNAFKKLIQESKEKWLTDEREQKAKEEAKRELVKSQMDAENSGQEMEQGCATNKQEKIITALDIEVLKNYKSEQIVIDRNKFNDSKENREASVVPAIKKRERGRPKKINDEKSHRIQVYLNQEERNFVSKLPMNGGISFKVKEIINDYKDYRLKEKNQADQLVSLARMSKKLLEKCNTEWNSPELTKTSVEIMKLGRQGRIYLDILSSRLSDYQKYFNEEEYRNLEFAISFSSRLEQ